LKAHEVMIRQVHKVKESDTVRSVVEKFIAHGISGLPVVNERNEIVGYISDGDIMRYIGKHDDLIVDAGYFFAVFKGDDSQFEERARQLLSLNVMKLAQKKVVKVQWDEEIENVAAILGKKKIKKVPVERNGVLVGIISRGNVIRQTFKSLL
jgi:CBS domain-containing protein